MLTPLRFRKAHAFQELLERVPLRLDQLIRSNHLKKPRLAIGRKNPAQNARGRPVRRDRLLAHQVYKKHVVPTDRHWRAGLHHIRDRRELQLIAPAIDIREQPARRLRKRNDRHIRRLPIRVADEKTPFSKSRSRLFHPTCRGGPMHCGGDGITHRGRLGSRIRLILFRNPIDRDFRVVAFTATSAKK